MGNATVAIKKRTGLVPTGAARIVDITLSSSYATRGDTVPLAALELSAVDVLVLTGGMAGYVAEAVHTAGAAPKIRLWEDKAAAGATPFLEEANATNVSTVVVRALVIGDLPNI